MEQASPGGASDSGNREPGVARRVTSHPGSVLVMSLSFGLAAGLLELLFLAIRVALFEKGFFLRSRNFLWMVPLSDLLILGVAGLLLSVPWPRIGRPSLRVPRRGSPVSRA